MSIDGAHVITFSSTWNIYQRLLAPKHRKRLFTIILAAITNSDNLSNRETLNAFENIIK